MSNLAEKEINSVKALTEKCEEMCRDAEDYESIILSTLSKQVKDSVREMQEEFNKERYDNKTLELLKQNVDRNAILMEYHLQAVCSKYKDIYMKRAYIENFCQQVCGKTKAITLGRITADNLVWSSYAKAMLQLKRRSLHLIFELTEEDVRLVEDIQKEI